MILTKANTGFYGFLLVVAVYFYCLPSGRFTFFGFNSDLRIYDFVGLTYVFWCYITFPKKIFNLFKSRRSPAYYSGLLIIALLVGVVISVIYNGLSFLPPTLIRFLRFIVYLHMLICALLFIDTPSKLRIVVKLFLFGVSIQACIGLLQYLGYIPNLWPEYWVQMYSADDDLVLFTGTLAPHHKHFSMIMLAGVALILGKLSVSQSKMRRVYFVALIILYSLVPLLSGTKTYLFTFALLLLVYISQIGFTKSFYLLAVTGMVFFIMYSTFQDMFFSDISSKLDSRLFKYFSQSGVDLNGVTTGRTRIYTAIFSTLLLRPYLLVTGTGFMNIKSFIPATGAHNLYLQYLMELGIWGLSIYLLYLNSFWRFYNQVKTNKSNFGGDYVLGGKLVLCVIIVSGLTGEVLYAQYSMMTLPGHLVILLSIGLIPRNIMISGQKRRL